MKRSEIRKVNTRRGLRSNNNFVLKGRIERDENSNTKHIIKRRRIRMKKSNINDRNKIKEGFNRIRVNKRIPFEIKERDAFSLIKSNSREHVRNEEARVDGSGRGSENGRRSRNRRVRRYKITELMFNSRRGRDIMVCFVGKNNRINRRDNSSIFFKDMTRRRVIKLRPMISEFREKVIENGIIFFTRDPFRDIRKDISGVNKRMGRLNIR